MTLLISMRGIGTNYYSIKEYILLKIYFLDKYNKKEVRAKITRKTYLINSLKAKMLLDIDIIGLEKIDLITSRNKIYIRSCDTIVAIDLKSRSRGVTMKSVVVDK